MRKFVFWTGVYNIVAATGFLFPPLLRLMGITPPQSNFWLWFGAAAVIFMGVVLILSSRDLPTRGSLVYWEGIMRLVAFLLFAGFGFFGGLGFMLGVFGCVDLLIGLVYLIGLPQMLGTTPADLLLDRMQ